MEFMNGSLLLFRNRPVRLGTMLRAKVMPFALDHYVAYPPKSFPKMRVVSPYFGDKNKSTLRQLSML